MCFVVPGHYGCPICFLKKKIFWTFFLKIQGGFFNWSAQKMTKCQITCKSLQKSSKCQNFQRVWHLVIFWAEQSKNHPVWKGLWRKKECLTVINLCENECRGKIARYTKVSRRVDPSPSLMTSGKADVFWRRAAKMTRDTDAPLNRIPGDLSQALVPSPPIFCLFSPTFPHFPSPFFSFAHSP